MKKQHNNGHSERRTVRQFAISRFIGLLAGTTLTLSLALSAAKQNPRQKNNYRITASLSSLFERWDRNSNSNSNSNDTEDDDDDKRLFENHGIPLAETFLVRDDEQHSYPYSHARCGDNEYEYDCDSNSDSEEKKGDDERTTTTNTNTVVVEIKTLVWEVVAAGTRMETTRTLSHNHRIGADAKKTTQRFHVVAALQVKDRVHLPTLKALVRNRLQHERNSRDEEGNFLAWSIQSMQLAPLPTAESLTGYRSGCMPPICHTTSDGDDDDSDDNELELYLDRSIFDVWDRHARFEFEFVAVGNGGDSGSQHRERDSGQEHDPGSGAGLICTVGSFTTGTNNRAAASEWQTQTQTLGSHTHNGNPSTPGNESNRATIGAGTGNDRKMMSGSEIRKLQQEERREQREKKKDRLKEYRGFRDDDIVNKAKLLRTTARKKGRAHEMEILLREALARGEFCKLMQIPDEQTPRTNIDKNALHICAWRGDYETVVRLVNIANEHCPELDVVNLVSKGTGNYGKTPIFYALTQCREDVVRYLVLEAGADLLIVNNKGQTPCSIARSHMTEETCKLLYKIEAEQLAARSKARGSNHDYNKYNNNNNNNNEELLFVNYRASVHSDGKLYGDLDPREGKYDNKEVSEQGRWADLNGYDTKSIYVGKDYMDRNDDLTDQMKEYEESVRSAPDGSVIGGIPTVFSPRSLRPTVRWWNRDDRSLAAANNDNTNANGQFTFTQSRPPRCKATDQVQPTEENGKRKGRASSNDVKKGSRFSEVDIESLELITIEDCIGSDASANDSGVVANTNAILVDNPDSLSRFEAELDKCLAELEQDLETSVATEDEGSNNTFGHNEAILLKHAWGLDCEWKPGPECGLDSPVATLQLGTSKKAFLIDLQTICRSQDRESLDQTSSMEIDLDRILLKLFRNPNLPLVGFGVIQDLGKLAASFPHLRCFSTYASVMDLQSVSSVVFNNKRDRRILSSLQKMTAALLNKKIDKTQQISDWSFRPLSDEQISYALLDAAIIPLLLNTIVEDSDVVERYNGQFFNVHKNLLSTIRFTAVQPCKEGFVYEVSFGSIKSMLGKAFARQSWPTKMKLEEPEPPKLVACQGISDDESSAPKVSKRERAHLRKIGGTPGRTRPKPIQLKSLTGNLENLPIPGIFLGYTKESCAFRVVGHELFKTIPEGTYIGFNRRSGVLETSNAWILFCNFGGEKAFSEFSDNGRQLSFRVSSAAQSGRSSESSLYRKVVKNSQSLTTQRHRDEKEKQILLFARESTRTKYMYCGFCSCAEVIPLDTETASLVLKLEEYEELMNPDKRISSDFEHLIGASQNNAS
eukprot:jgi/Psemu1/41967/gm1.41967_g